jgi:hypothetical protein
MTNCFLPTSAVIGLALAAVWFSGAHPAFAATKIIGDWEGVGSMTSPYSTTYDVDDESNPSCGHAAGPVSWCTSPGAVADMTLDWINVNDMDYVGGVTHGEWALKITHPVQWNGGPYLRLHGQEELMDDIADFPYMLIDVTTLGPLQDPTGVEPGPYRQMFSIFNLPPPPEPSFFYDANYDSDIQREIEIAEFGQDFHTYTVVVDMTAMSPVNGDDKNVMNVTADFYRTNHNDGTPIPGFLYQLVWVFQGRDYPEQPFIETIIDNVRFCDDSLAACLAPPEGPLGDYNDDGTVNAADYAIWRQFENTMTQLPNDGGLGGTVGLAHYNLWRNNFGSTQAGSGAAAAPVPEAATFLLAINAMIAISLVRRVRG